MNLDFDFRKCTSICRARLDTFGVMGLLESTKILLGENGPHPGQVAGLLLDFLI